MPEARRDDVLVRSTGDDLVAVDVRGDVVHALTAPAASVWQQCDGRTDTGHARRLTGLTEDEFTSALAELSAAGPLVERGLDRRTLLKGAATVGAGAIALPTVWSIVAPTAAMAVSGGGTQPPDFTLTQVMTSYLAEESTAAGPFTFYAGPADAGFEWDGSMATAFNTYYPSTNGLPGFSAGSPGEPPLVNMNTTGDTVDAAPNAPQESGWIAVSPSADASVIIGVAIPEAPGYDVTVQCFARHFDATASSDGVRFAVYSQDSGGTMHTASANNDLKMSSSTLSAIASQPALGGYAYMAIDCGSSAGSDWTMVLMNVSFAPAP
ncbi:MAG TPA: hypothetical protein VFJ98_01195 [Mycobacteriales bacterium]|nr:hypothetical protein [Mycobacteriales bacterium]